MLEVDNMPNQIQPNLDPVRFQYLNPLVFGEYSTHNDTGWIPAISQILSYYQGQKPFQDALLDFGELGNDILEAWKENLVQELVDNDAVQLAELVLQTLILVTGEQVDGVEPLIPPENPQDLPEPEPEKPAPDSPEDREPFPPVISPRSPQPPGTRDTQPTVPEEPGQPQEPSREPQQPPTRRNPPSSPGIPGIPTFPTPSLPRVPVPEVPREPVPEDTQEPEESPSRDEPEPQNGDGTGDDTEEPVQGKIEIDYGALEQAIFNALKRWYDVILGNPPTITVQTETPPEVPVADLIPEIMKQVDIYNEAGKLIASDNAPTGKQESQNIFTIPGE